jgi:outer membrane lipoprotein-sorting protein
MISSKSLLLSAFASLCLPVAVLAAEGKTAPGGLTAAQIVEKHITARGGLAAWRAVQAMSWAGKMDAGVGDSAARSAMYVKGSFDRTGKMKRAAMGATDKSEAQDKASSEQQVELPFVLEMKRPGKSRLEIEFAGKTAVQVYDGAHGWKVRPFLNRNDVEPFTADETKSQVGKWDMDGPLLDYAAKGTKVAFEAVEPVDGHDAYKLKLTMKNGSTTHMWIDTQSFLDVKVEGVPRRMDGRMHTVWVTQRDFRSVQGVKVPFVLETSVDGYRDTHKMVLDKVAVNPQLSDARFTKPGA